MNGAKTIAGQMSLTPDQIKKMDTIKCEICEKEVICRSNINQETSCYFVAYGTIWNSTVTNHEEYQLRCGIEPYYWSLESS